MQHPRQPWRLFICPGLFVCSGSLSFLINPSPIHPLLRSLWSLSNCLYLWRHIRLNSIRSRKTQVCSGAFTWDILSHTQVWQVCLAELLRVWLQIIWTSPGGFHWLMTFYWFGQIIHSNPSIHPSARMSHWKLLHSHDVNLILWSEVRGHGQRRQARLGSALSFVELRNVVPAVSLELLFLLLLELPLKETSLRTQVDIPLS